jgi:hypothetical protein
MEPRELPPLLQPPGTRVNFDADDLEIAWYCASAAISSRREKHQPIPDELHRHMARLDLAIRCVSSPGHEIDGDASPLKPEEDWLTTREAAAVLNRSTRQTRRIKADLHGQIIRDRLLFPRHAVESYAEERISH